MDTKTAMFMFGGVSLVCVSGWLGTYVFWYLVLGHWFLASALLTFGPVAMLIAACTGGGGFATLAGVLMLIDAIFLVPPHGLDVD